MKFIPNGTGKFRFWCQKVLPLVYDDSLSYYEVLCKLVNFVNELAERVANAFDELNLNIKEYVEQWLDDHPEATTTVTDNSITFAKLNSSLKGNQTPYTIPYVNEDGSGLGWDGSYVTPEMFGAVGDGVADDSTAWQSALDANKMIICKPDATYKTTVPLRVKANTTILLNGCTIKATNLHLFFNFLDSDVFTLYNGNGNITIRDGVIEGGGISFIHAKNVLFDNINFKNCLNDHYIEICACNNFKVTNCTFVGMTTTATSQKEYINIDNCIATNFPHFSDADSMTYDGTIVDGVLIENCLFDRHGTTMQDAVGKHGYYSETDMTERRARNIWIINCKAIGATECAFMLRGVENAVVDSCVMESCDKPVEARYSNYVTISNNICTGVNGYCRTQYLNHFKFINNHITMATNNYIINFSGANDDVEYSGNVSINTLGNLAPLRFYLLGSISNFRVMNNINKTASPRAIMDPPSSGTFQFANCDNIKFWEGNASVATNSYLNLTDFNRLVVQSGAISAGNYSEFIVKSFFGRNFVVGETYPVVHYNGSEVVVDTVTITDEHTLTFTDNYIRGVTVQALPML